MMFTIRGIPTAGIAVGTAFVLQRRASAAATAAAGDPVAEAGRFHAALERAKAELSGENLFTHSPMFKHTDMFDPEVITSGDSDFAASTTSGLNGTGNGYSYPMLKTVTLGINVTF